MHRRFPAIAFAVLALATSLLTGCSSPCRQLSEKLCECAPTRQEKEFCKQQVSTRESRAEPTDADQKTCEGLIQTCDCNNLQTAEGKRACGLAR